MLTRGQPLEEYDANMVMSVSVPRPASRPNDLGMPSRIRTILYCLLSRCSPVHQPQVTQERHGHQWSSHWVWTSPMWAPNVHYRSCEVNSGLPCCTCTCVLQLPYFIDGDLKMTQSKAVSCVPPSSCARAKISLWLSVTMVAGMLLQLWHCSSHL